MASIIIISFIRFTRDTSHQSSMSNSKRSFLPINFAASRAIVFWGKNQSTWVINKHIHESPQKTIYCGAICLVTIVLCVHVPYIKLYRFTAYTMQADCSTIKKLVLFINNSSLIEVAFPVFCCLFCSARRDEARSISVTIILFQRHITSASFPA